MAVTTTGPTPRAQQHHREQAAFEAEVALAAGVRNAADARLVTLVARGLAEGRWEGHGIHTPVQWLMWRTGVQRATATRILLLARRAAELPTVMASFTAGRLSLDQAATVARYVPADFEVAVCELAENATVSQIVAATRRYDFDFARTRAGGGPSPADPPPAPPEREVAFGPDDQGQWRAKVRLPADEGAVVEQALQRVRDRLHTVSREAAKAAATAQGRPTAGTDRSLGVEKVSWADALVGMARSALGRKGQGAESPADTKVIVHLERPVGGDGWWAELHGGPSLPDPLRRYLTCDGSMEVSWEADGIPVLHAQHHRIVPRRIRRLVERRDRGCRVPGCDSHLWVQVHHIIHWEDDGLTVTWNLICLCAKHHRQHHQGLLGITGNADRPDGIIFTNQHGLRLGPAGRPMAAEPEAMPTVAPYRGPTGERLHRDCVFFTPAGTASSGSRAGPAPPDG